MEKEMNEKKMNYVKMLKENVCEVVFEKVDGSMRTMSCTLMESMLPESQEKESSEKETTNVCAFDVEKQAWRSFRPGSVRSFMVKPQTEAMQANV